MSDNPKEAEREMEKAIFICGDCWLEVFDLLPPSQLGLGIALISHRFDYFVDEHFKTRKWKLRPIVIQHKIGENGAKEMEIVNNFGGKALPIPQIPLPNKVIGFRSIWIYFIDQNVITFLGHFDRFFASCTTMLEITTGNVSHFGVYCAQHLAMFKDTIYDTMLIPIAFHQMRQFAPSLLNDCPSLRFVTFYDGISLEFPPDDSANASDGQALTKWLFTPRHDNFMKELRCYMNSAVEEEQWSAIVEQTKASFSAASSPSAFRISVLIPPSSSLSSVLPFELTNELTGEKLALSKEDEEEDLNGFSLIRCPILPDERQQTIKELGDRWNRIDFFIGDDGVGEGLLDAASAGPSGVVTDQNSGNELIDWLLMRLLYDPNVGH